MLTNLLFLIAVSFGQEPNPPTWPDHVYVFYPSDSSTTQQTVDEIYKNQGGPEPCDNGQWSTDQYAFLFAPGSHDVNVSIGYYTGLYGLGVSPMDTKIRNVGSYDGCSNTSIGALNNFWRSAENFQVAGNMTWSVSQAAPLRKAYVNGDLNFSQYGYASGGYSSDCIVSGTVYPGAQQQWFSRNMQYDTFSGGNWNMVFVGNDNNPETHCGQSEGNPYTSTPETPIIAEKPYIVMNEDGTYSLYVPGIQTYKFGPTQNFETISKIIDFSQVYVANTSSTITTINSKLAAGLVVLFTPGNYEFEESIVINNDNATLIGIGLPAISATNGNALITVGNNDGVRIVGPFLLQGGAILSETIVQIGNKGYEGSSSNPVILYDVFVRIGGPNDPSVYQMQADSMMIINSGYTIVDNTWLWRADHDVTGLVYDGANPVNNGLIINGDNVVTYGLMTEHTLQDLVVWNGNNGRCYFYQSEFPYDVTSSYANSGYASVRINGNNFMGLGMGAYTYFRDYTVVVPSCFVGPESGINMTNILGVFLGGNGGFEHIYNSEGDGQQNGFGVQYLCNN